MKILKKWIALLIPVLFFSQEIKPDFIKEIEKGIPNLYKADSLFNRYKENIEGKPLGYYEEYYKEKGFLDYWHSVYHHWRFEKSKYSNEDGFIIEPSDDAIIKRSLKSNETNILNRKATTKTSALSNQWTYFGPSNTYNGNGSKLLDRTSNILCIDRSKSSPDILYCGPQGGGAYKSIDEGLTWFNITMNVDIGNSLSLIKIHPDDPNKVFFVAGSLVYSTLDGGINWRVTNIPANLTIPSNQVTNERFYNGAILPKTATEDEKIFIIGKLGVFNYSFETNTVTIDPNFNKSTYDIQIDPSNPNSIYMMSYDIDDGIQNLYRSDDRGITYSKLSSPDNGWYSLPSGITEMEKVVGGKIGLTIANPNIIYILHLGSVNQDFGYIGMYKSEDRGSTWVRLDPFGPGVGSKPYNTTDHVNLAASRTGTYHQGFYNSGLVVNPLNANEFIVGGIVTYRTTDGGVTYTGLADSGNGGSLNMHSDIQSTHTMVINGVAETIVTNDGGITYSKDFFATNPERRMKYLPSTFWGFDVGIFHKAMTGGRYHNGNAAYYPTYDDFNFKWYGGAESPEGTIQFENEERTMSWADTKDKIIDSDFNQASEGIDNLEVYPYMKSSAPAAGVSKALTGSFFYIGRGENKSRTTKAYKLAGRDVILLHEFESNIYSLQVCAKNENYLYATVFEGKKAKKLYKSSNGGFNWDLVHTFTENNNFLVVVDDENPEHIWVYGFNTKIFKKSTDGGINFVDLNEPPLSISELVLQWSSNNMYAFKDNSVDVYHYDKVNDQWNMFNSGLPLSSNILTLKISYSDQKLMAAQKGLGIWETDLYSSSQDDISYLSIYSPRVIAYDKTESFVLSNIAYGIDRSTNDLIWESNSDQVVFTDNGDGTTSIVFNQYGIYDVVLKQMDKTTGEEINRTIKKYYVYPGCSFDGESNAVLIPMKDMLIWFDGSNLQKDTESGEFYVKNIWDQEFTFHSNCDPANESSVVTHNYNNTSHKAIAFNGVNNCRLNFDKSYEEGKTFFWVLNETEGISNKIRDLLGHGIEADFHAGKATTKRILNSNRVSKFDLTKLNGNIFDPTVTDRPIAPSVISFRVAEGELARFSNFSKQKSFSDRVWNGNLAELLIYSRKLTDEEIQKVEQYLLKKYKITP